MSNCDACGTATEVTATICPSCGSPVLADSYTTTLPPGTVLDERSRLDVVLGQGGFGITYRAHDTRLDRQIAIKEMFPGGCIRQGVSVVPTGPTATTFHESRVQFVREAQNLGRLRHPSIVQVYEVFETANTAYLVMELLHGTTYEERVSSTGPLDVAETTKVLRSVASALELVHQDGVLHRDVKPSNLMCVHGEPILIDFGAARTYANEITTDMSRLVTPGYSPLEQYSGRGRFGPTSDVYSLAATGYFLLTGKPPVGAVERIQGAELAPLSADAQHIGLGRAITAGLEIAPADRPANMAQFVGHIDQNPGFISKPVGANQKPGQVAATWPIGSQTPIHGSVWTPTGVPPTALQTPKMSPKLRIGLAAVGTAVAFLGLVGGSYVVTRSGKSKVPTIGATSVSPMTGTTEPVSPSNTISPALSTKPVIEIPVGAPPKELPTKDFVVGAGPEAVKGSTVRVQYVGVAWSTRKQFDASWDRGAQPYDVVDLGNAPVIAGWNEGLIGVREGSRRQLIIPPDKGYGDSAKPGIKAGETLVFVVDIVAVSPPGGAATTVPLPATTLDPSAILASDNGYGPLRIGMTEQQVVASGLVENRTTSPTCEELLRQTDAPNNPKNVDLDLVGRKSSSVHLWEDRIVSIHLTEPWVHENGISNTSSLDDVAQTYGSRTQLLPYDEVFDSIDLNVPSAPDGLLYSATGSDPSVHGISMGIGQSERCD